MTKAKPRTRSQKQLRIVKRVNKKHRGKYGTYSRPQFELALTAVLQKTLTLNAAAKQFHVPKTSLFNHLRYQSGKLLLDLHSEQITTSKAAEAADAADTANVADAAAAAASNMDSADEVNATSIH